jgi:hypothetical protein
VVVLAMFPRKRVRTHGSGADAVLTAYDAAPGSGADAHYQALVVADLVQTVLRLVARDGRQAISTQLNMAGQTALHTAVADAYHPLTVWLLANGASPDVGDSEGNTPVHYCDAENMHSLELLLAAGGSTNARNENGRTPLHTAVMRDDVVCVAALLSVPRTNPAVHDYSGETPEHLGRRLGHVQSADLIADCVEARRAQEELRWAWLGGLVTCAIAKGAV